MSMGLFRMPKPLTRLACAVAVAALGMGALPGITEAAQPTPPTPAQAVKPTDWTGIWTREGSLNFDPSIPGRDTDKPPYNAEYAARFAKILESEARGEPINDLSADCLPPGLVKMMNMVYPMEILQNPSQLTIIAEWMGQTRRIFTDGRPHPVDPDPTYNGHSIGRWEGNVLVVDTVGLKGGAIINDHGAPLGEKLHVTERFWQSDKDTLHNEMTVESPDALTRPIKATKTYKRRKDIQIMEYVCAENNRNPVDAKGVTGIILR